MAEMVQTSRELDLHDAVKAILDTVDREREREIITRRFGLYERRETLEQIGELLGITRERVRQLEKAILTRLQSQSATLPKLAEAQVQIARVLEGHGGLARTRTVAAATYEESGEREMAHVAFIATLSPELEIIEENDNYYHGVVHKNVGAKQAKQHIDDLVNIVKKHGKPTTIDVLAKEADFDGPGYVESVATLSKKLANLKNQWGLLRWPTVNPKNIRDKIYVVLKDAKQPMHFSDIAAAIRKSSFKRKDVTVQAIHNELIKDKRFVLIGRGIYALEEWGYKKGTVADIITEVLKKSSEPLHRDEIIRRVLEKRQVKETTILLNLQGKPQFKRVAKATYGLAE